MSEEVHWRLETSRLGAIVKVNGRDCFAELVFRNYGDQAGWKWNIRQPTSGRSKRYLAAGHELSQEAAEQAVAERLRQLNGAPEPEKEPEPVRAELPPVPTTWRRKSERSASP